MINCDKIEEMSKEMGCYACSQGMFEDGSGEPENPDGVAVVLNNDNEIMNDMMSKENATIKKLPSETKYIFIRLYNPKYIHPNISTILKNGQKIINTNELFVTHAAINFNLKDEFFGLILNTNPNDNYLKIEKCTDLSFNIRMKDNDPVISKFYVYAIPVTDSEYKSAFNMVSDVYKNNNVVFTLSSLFKFVLPGINRKIHDIRIDGSPEKHDAIVYNSVEDGNIKKEKYCCSTFVAAILFKNVKKVNKFCVKNHLQPEDFTPSDLTLLPNMYKLFNGSYKDYNILKNKFIKLNPEFNIYK